MIVDVALYQNGLRTPATPDISDQVEIARDQGGFVWVGLSEPSKAEFDHIVGELNFHPLAVEDAVLAKQRPKIEDYAGLTFFVIKTVFYNEAKFNNVSQIFDSEEFGYEYKIRIFKID